MSQIHRILIGFLGPTGDRMGPRSLSREPLPKKSGWILWFMVDITWYNYSIHGDYFMVYKPTFTSLGGTILHGILHFQTPPSNRGMCLPCFAGWPGPFFHAAPTVQKKPPHTWSNWTQLLQQKKKHRKSKVSRSSLVSSTSDHISSTIFLSELWHGQVIKSSSPRHGRKGSASTLTRKKCNGLEKSNGPGNFLRFHG